MLAIVRSYFWGHDRHDRVLERSCPCRDGQILDPCSGESTAVRESCKCVLEDGPCALWLHGFRSLPHGLSEPSAEMLLCCACQCFITPDLCKCHISPGACRPLLTSGQRKVASSDQEAAILAVSFFAEANRELRKTTADVSTEIATLNLLYVSLIFQTGFESAEPYLDQAVRKCEQIGAWKTSENNPLRGAQVFNAESRARSHVVWGVFGCTMSVLWIVRDD